MFMVKINLLEIKLIKTPKTNFKPTKENCRRSDLELLFKQDIELFEKHL